MKLFIVRHGQTVWNIEKRLQGWTDSDLTELGVDNAVRLGKSLEKINFKRIISSPTGRANKTAEIIRQSSSHSGTTSIETDERLREIGLGDWEGRKLAEIEELEPDLHHAFTSKPELFQASNGESFKDVHQRAASFLNRLVADNGESDDNILVVSHTVTIKSMLTYLLGHSISELWNGTPHLHPTCLSKVAYRECDGGFIVEVIGDMSHTV